MFGMVEDLKDSNYKIISKKININLPKNLSLSYFEDKIKTPHDKLLKWAIINIENNVATIYTTYVSREE